MKRRSHSYRESLRKNVLRSAEEFWNSYRKKYLVPLFGTDNYCSVYWFKWISGICNVKWVVL